MKNNNRKVAQKYQWPYLWIRIYIFKCIILCRGFQEEPSKKEVTALWIRNMS